eukprot:CAMPEP_0171129330 /NCGR_PEP_ID=MMETSP0766_2-20121228/118724_1 /TAXON_ID=439317 /ORGANISM="Gambierdiscus australes, Strain CAWD 149" /LENGTH=32 /DNA_ID= /DNA_START= /DNA_END= /DNA_ORIENTATION=
MPLTQCQTSTSCPQPRRIEAAATAPAACTALL